MIAFLKLVPFVGVTDACQVACHRSEKCGGLLTYRTSDGYMEKLVAPWRMSRGRGGACWDTREVREYAGTYKQLLRRRKRPSNRQLLILHRSSTIPDLMWTSSQVASTIDHAALKPDMTNDDIRAAAALGRKYRTASVCVRPSDVALTASLLKDSGVKTCMVVGFPHGANRPEIKALEARLGIADGAEELDMVMNVGKFLSGDYDWVRRDIEGVVAEARRAGNVIVKVILETCYLSPEGIARACQIACGAGAVFVKTFDRIRIRRGHARGDRYHDQDGRPADGCEGIRRHPRFPDRLRVPGPGMHASWRRQHRRSAGRKRRCDGGVLRP